MPLTPNHTQQFPVTGLKHLPVFTDQVTDFISRSVPLPPPQLQTLLFRCKTIISELLTNTIKHAEQDKTLLEVHIFEDAVQITRRDGCAPLQLRNKADGQPLHWPLPSLHHNTSHIVYGDDLNTLLLRIDQQGKGKFEALQNSSNDFNVNSLHEHYGLLLIALCSQLFTYLYDTDANENVFTAIVKL